ncbi:MAG: hypothetical protein CL678_13605 [Bdellovibrionaceae bacterium]|nr:hypothetical protein [Pseudobdellovibrionaceae bacterium]|tara:strand:- start:2349 stop:3275 length:927 start_codon:yes stop_codon:yes gene_type:complete
MSVDKVRSRFRVFTPLLGSVLFLSSCGPHPLNKNDRSLSVPEIHRAKHTDLEPTHWDFQHWCEAAESLEPDLQKTIEVVLEHFVPVGKSCAGARKTLALRSKMILDRRRLVLLDPLSSFSQLKVLSLRMNLAIESVEPLGNLTSLEFLNIGKNRIRSLSALKNLSRLQDLRADRNLIRSLDGITELKQLKKLNLSYNPLSDLSGLQNLDQLEWLSLAGNEIQDLSFLSSLNQLKYLSLRDNRIQSLSSLSHLSSLEYLDLSRNKISSLEGLYPLTQLKELYLGENKQIKWRALRQLRRNLPKTTIYYR